MQEIYHTLCELLPPPPQYEAASQESLRNVIRLAVDISIEMRTQRAEYMMLPPLQPEYNIKGELARKVYFNAALMNDRSGGGGGGGGHGGPLTNEELEAQQAVVRIVLFPLVVTKGIDDTGAPGAADEQIVVCPAQVLVGGTTPAPGSSTTTKTAGRGRGAGHHHHGAEDDDGMSISVDPAAMSTLDMSNVV